MAFPPKNLKNWVDSREYSRPIKPATYPPFTKGTGQHSKHLFVFLNELAHTRVQVQAVKFLIKILLRVEVALAFFFNCFVIRPNDLRGQLIIPVLATLLGVVK